MSGDKGKDNGLTHSWLSSSLEISPVEQVTFLQNLVNRQLPVSSKAYNITKRIIFVEELPNGWKLYGKTGSCAVMNETRTQKLKDKHNEWFVGWIEKEDRVIIRKLYPTLR